MRANACDLILKPGLPIDREKDQSLSNQLGLVFKTLATFTTWCPCLNGCEALLRQIQAGLPRFAT
jgi:hypothetical protein